MVWGDSRREWYRARACEGTARRAGLQTPERTNRTDSLLCARLRHCIWHDWKRPERKRKNLIRMGVPKGQAYAWSRTRKGGWAVAHSPMLITTVTVKRLAKRGYESLIDYYRKVAPQLNESLYARPACTVV